MNDPVLNLVQRRKAEEDFINNIYYFCSHECCWDYDTTQNAPIWYVMKLMSTHNKINEEQKKQMKSKRRR